MKKNHLPHNNGFKVPKDYFNSFEERLNTQLYLDDKKSNSFKTPDNYFENFKVNLPQNETSKVIRFSSKKTIIIITSIAATIALLLTLTFNTKQQNLNNLDSELLSAYVYDEIETEDLNLFLEDVSLNEADFLKLKNDNLEQVINDIELEDIIQD